MRRPSYGFLKALILLGGVYVGSAWPDVVINEVMALNVISSPEVWDFNAFSPWIELYNPGDAEVDLTGYYLTNRLKTPGLWGIPAGTKIGAKGYLVFWADRKNAKPGDTATRNSYDWTEKYTLKYYQTR
jgi:hypothetical protein